MEEFFGLCMLWGWSGFGGLFGRVGAVPGRCGCEISIRSLRLEKIEKIEEADLSKLL